MEVCYVSLWIAFTIGTSIDAMLWDVLPSMQPPVSDGPPAELTAVSDTSFCTDRHGNLVADGAVFVPGDDPCRKCHCAQGAAAMCTLVHCSAPPCVLWEPVPDECCQFHCIVTSLGSPYDPHGSGMRNRNFTIIPVSTKEVDAVSLGIRLAASAVSSLLIVVLLLFMVQRLRQRRLLITMRRLYNENRSSDDFVAYATSIDQSDSGFDFPSHEEPPPPYSLVNKPCDDEPPPSYDQVNEEVSGDAVVSGGQDEVASSSAEGQGLAGRDSNHHHDLDFRCKQRGTKFWLVDGINDVISCGTDSIELCHVNSASASSNTPNAVNLCEGSSVQRVRPYRKRCAKCRHSTDANVTRNGNHVRRPLSLQGIELNEIPVDSVKSNSRKSLDNASGHLLNPGKILNEQQFKKPGRFKQHVSSNSANNVEDGVSILQVASAADPRIDDVMLCSAPAEMCAEGRSERQTKKFQMGAEYRGTYHPVSFDLGDINQQKIVDYCQLHSKDPSDNWFLKSRRSNQQQNSHNLPEDGRVSLVVKRERSSAIAVAESKNKSRRQSCVDDGDLSMSVIVVSPKPLPGGSSSRLDHVTVTPKVLNEYCHGNDSSEIRNSNSSESVSSICAETGEKKARPLSSWQTDDRDSTRPGSTTMCENVAACTFADPPSAKSSEAVSSSQFEPSPETRHDHNSTHPEMCSNENEMSLANESQYHGPIEFPTDLYSELDERRRVVTNRACTFVEDQTRVTYEHAIDRILEQIEAARVQFRWERHPETSSVRASEVDSNWLHRYQRRSMASCTENVSETEGTIPKISTPNNVEILDWMNSNVNPSID